MNVNPKDIKFLQDKRLIKSKQIYDGAILQLYVNQLENERGQIIDRELIHHSPAVAILPITNDGQVVLVRQYREAVADYLYEIPAGIIERFDGVLEEPLLAAKRELEEETGYQADKWCDWGKFYLSPGFMDEKIYLYLAQDLKIVPDPLEQDPDEVIELFHFDQTQIQEMISKGEIVDAKTLLALNRWLSDQK